MNFFILLSTCTFSFAFRKHTSYNAIKQWLDEENLAINELCKEFDNNLLSQVSNERALRVFKREIQELQKRENNEHAICLKLLNLYQHPRINAIIEALLNDLNAVRMPFIYESTKIIIFEPKMHNDFHNALINNSLDLAFRDCRNSYTNIPIVLVRPGIENDEKFIDYLQTIIDKQIKRVEYLQIELTMLKFQEIFNESNPSENNF